MGLWGTLETISVVSGRRDSVSRKTLERAAIEGESPVDEDWTPAQSVPEYRGARGISRETGGTTLQGEIL